MTIRDNDDTGYDSDTESERNEEQKMEQERMKRDNPRIPTSVPVRDNPEVHLDILDEENVGETPVGC